MIAVDTKNILFICGGAFEGIEKKIAQRLNTTVVGYGAGKTREVIDKSNLLQYVLRRIYEPMVLYPKSLGACRCLPSLARWTRLPLGKFSPNPKMPSSSSIKLFDAMA